MKKKLNKFQLFIDVCRGSPVGRQWVAGTRKLYGNHAQMVQALFSTFVWFLLLRIPVNTFINLHSEMFIILQTCGMRNKAMLVSKYVRKVLNYKAAKS